MKVIRIVQAVKKVKEPGVLGIFLSKRIRIAFRVEGEGSVHGWMSAPELF